MIKKLDNMKIIYALIILLVIFLILLGIVLVYKDKEFGTADFSDFCGISTKGSCTSDSDCIRGGCNAEVCQSSSEELRNTVCQAKECFDDEKYNAVCSCVASKCQWDEKLSGDSISSSSSSSGACQTHADCSDFNCNSGEIPGCDQGQCTCIASGGGSAGCTSHSQCSYLDCDEGEIAGCSEGTCQCIS
ncbi:MAG: hypothetical protein ABIH72_00555 [archaeon]